jgi:hypothetical protein
MSQAHHHTPKPMPLADSPAELSCAATYGVEIPDI